MTNCRRCKHPLELHTRSYSSPAGDDGTMGKYGYHCAEYWGCGCWLDELPQEEPELPFAEAK